jgi:hypothetical protein
LVWTGAEHFENVIVKQRRGEDIDSSQGTTGEFSRDSWAVSLSFSPSRLQDQEILKKSTSKGEATKRRKLTDS